MSGELKLVLSILYSKGGAVYERTIDDSIDQTGDSFTVANQSVGTTEEELTQHADLGTPGFVFVHNLDDTNYVEVGSTTGVYDIKLLAGQWAIYPHNSATVYAKANTAAVLLEYAIFEL